MDSQARDSFAEHVVYCRRFDRFKIPVLHLLGIKPPKLHLGIVKYGDRENSPTVDRWMYRGTYLYNAYDTEQQFTANDEIQGLASVLPPFYTHGQYTTKWREFKDGLKRFRFGKYQFFSIGALLAAFTVNALVTYEPEQPKKGIWSCNEAYKQLFGSCSAKPVAPYEYYYPKPEQKPEDKAAETATEPKKTIYIAGWEKTSTGYNMAFVTDDGEPFYPTYYKVITAGDCTALVLLPDGRQQINCMPDKMAYAEIKNDALSVME